MKIWKNEFTLKGINNMSSNTLVDLIDIKFVDFGDDYLVAEMPVTPKNIQIMHILHGGASVVLAETVGSIASLLCLGDPMRYQPVGLNINANHLRSVPKGGKVYAKVTPIHIGKKTHVWHIEIRDEQDKITCVSRLSTMIIKNNN